MTRNRYIEKMAELCESIDTDNSRLPGWTSAAEILLYRETGDRRYIERTRDLLRVILEDYQRIGVVQLGLRLTGFKIPYRIVLMARICREEGLLEDSEIALLNQFFTDLLSEAEYERGSMNRAFGYLAAIHPVLAWIPDHPKREELLEVERLVLSDLTEHFEADEDSYGYGALTIVNLITWLKESKLEHLYQHPKMRQCFENILDMWSGIGRASIYGDWRPTEPAWGWYLCTMEKAATVYRDGRFKWAARVIFENYERTLKEKPDWFHHHDLYGLAHAFDAADESIEEVKPDSPSKLIYRNDGHPERAMFRTRWDTSDLLAMVSLASGNEHGHTDPLAINGLIGDGVIFEDNGRNGVEPFYHNLLHVADSPEDFPVPRTRIPNDTWQTLRGSFHSQRNYGRFRPEASFPFDYTHQVGNDIPPEFGYDPKKEWVFLLGMKVYGEGYDFDLGSVTLVGDDSPRQICDFTQQEWIGLSDVIDDPDTGKAGRFHIRRTVSDNPAKEDSDWSTTVYIGVKLPGTFSIAHDGYHSIEMDYRLTGHTAADTIQLLCIGEENGYPRKWMFNELPHFPVQVRSFQDNPDLTHGVFEYSERSPSRRTIHRSRDVLLTRRQMHDFLFISDRVRVEDGDAYTAAPLWHVMNPVDMGNGWFEIAYEGRALLWLLPKSDTTVEIKSREELDRFDVDTYHTHAVYRVKNCRGDHTELFETLIVPLKSGESAKALKDSITLESSESGRVLTIGEDRQILHST